MATLTFTITAGGYAGSQLRALAAGLEQAASYLPGDSNSTGASVTCVIDNAPSSGFATVAVAGGGLASTQTVRV